jgi:hypothetical protein
MSEPLSVNDVIAKAADLDGREVSIRGIIHFSHENESLNHWPVSERTRGRPPQSSIWLTFDTHSPHLDKDMRSALNGKLAAVRGKLIVGTADMGCGHMGLWRAALHVIEFGIA